MRDREAQLEWEARAGRIAAAFCLLAAALIVGAFAYRIGVLPRGASNVKELLPQVHAHKGEFLIAGVLTALAMLAFIPPLLYLYEATHYRRAELPPIARILAIVGPILFAICAVWFPLRQAHASDLFLAGANKSNKHAEDLLRNSTTVIAGLSLAASIATGLSTILIALNAMRAGLLSRFMGVLGIILGVLFVLPLIASPVIQLFWVLALGALYLNQWPGGRGPAWDSGEAEDWPARERPGLAPLPRGEEANGDAPPAEAAEPEAEPQPAARSTASANASRKKKKRKARR